jgi:hypothetical protein
VRWHRPGEGEDVAVTEAVERALGQLFEALLLDIVRMAAGDEVDMEYVDESVRGSLARLFAPPRRLGIMVDMQFSEPVALGVAYVEDDDAAAIWVEVETDEWTTYTSVHGSWRHPLPCHQRRLVAEVDPSCRRILQLGRSAA